MRRIDRAAARRLAKLFDDGSSDSSTPGSSPNPGFFAQQGASLNAPPDDSGHVSGVTGTYGPGYLKPGGIVYDARQGAEHGEAPSIPNALPPPSAGTVETGKSSEGPGGG